MDGKIDGIPCSRNIFTHSRVIVMLEIFNSDDQQHKLWSFSKFKISIQNSHQNLAKSITQQWIIVLLEWRNWPVTPK